jgi:hypothetical protein
VSVATREHPQTVPGRLHGLTFRGYSAIGGHRVTQPYLDTSMVQRQEVSSTPGKNGEGRDKLQSLQVGWEAGDRGAFLSQGAC